MSRFITWVLSVLFISNIALSAFAANCNLQAMAKSGRHADWSNGICIRDFTCALRGTENSESWANFIIQKYNLWKEKMENGNSADFSLSPRDINAVGAAVGLTFPNSWSTVTQYNHKGTFLQRTSAARKETMRLLCRNDVCAQKASACNTSMESYILEKADESRNTSQSGVSVSLFPASVYNPVIADIPYSNAEFVYEYNKAELVPCFGLEEAMKKHIQNDIDSDRVNIKEAVSVLIGNSLGKSCGNQEFLSYENLKYLFLVYAKRLTSEEKKFLLSYLGSEYPDDVRFAAANAAMAFSKYSLKPAGGLTENNPAGKFEYTPKERHKIKDIITEDWNVHHKGNPLLYAFNIRRLFSNGGSDNPVTFAVVNEQTGEIYQTQVNPELAYSWLNLLTGREDKDQSAIAPAMLGFMAREAYITLTWNINLGSNLLGLTKAMAANSNAAVETAASKLLADTTSGGPGSTVIIPLSAFVAVGIMYYDVNDSFEAQYQHVKEISLQRYIDSFVSALSGQSGSAAAGAGSWPENWEYVYNPALPVDTVELFVKGMDKITLSRSEANTWAISTTCDAPHRLTCRDIEPWGFPSVKRDCRNRPVTNRCIKEEYQFTKIHIGHKNDHAVRTEANHALQYEDLIASTKTPTVPITWRIAYHDVFGWLPYGEISMSPWENLRTGNRLKISTGLTAEELLKLLAEFKDSMQNGVGMIKDIQCGGGNTMQLRIGGNEVQGNGKGHIHLEEIKTFSHTRQKYICNHGIFFRTSGNLEEFVYALLGLFY